MSDSFWLIQKMCSTEKKITLAIVMLLVLLIIFGSPFKKSESFDEIDINGQKIRVDRSPMGWLTSGADLRDQTTFSGTNQ